MAITTGTAIALALAAASAGMQYHNTRQTARRQDQQAAQSIRNQTRIQREADDKVNAKVDELAGSTSRDDRQRAMDSYVAALRRGRGKTQAGFDPGFGSAAFQQGAEEAAQGVETYGLERAGLMSRMDAPTLQRQGEAVATGHLATDISRIGRESSGQRFIDDLRLRAIRRNAGLDLAAGLLGGAGGAVAGMGGGGAAADAFAPATNTLTDSALGSAWGRPNSLIWGNYGGLR